MKTLAKVASALALAGTVAPPALYLVGRLELASVHFWMLAASVLWFAAAPLWMASGDGQ
jgi:hypothetical protein